MSIRFMNLHFNRARRGQLDAAGPIDKQAGSTGLSRYQFLIAVLADIRYQPLLRSIQAACILGEALRKRCSSVVTNQTIWSSVPRIFLLQQSAI